MLDGMRRKLRAASLVLGILLLSIAGLVYYLKSIDFNDYKPQIQDAVRQASGRALSIDGRLQLAISLHPLLSVEGVHLANAAGGSRANMVDVQRLEIRLNLWSLLSGNLLVEYVNLVRPDILLETLADGSDNWIFAGAASGEYPAADAPDESASTPTILPQVHRVMISEAKLSYHDAASGRMESIKIPHLELWEDGDGDDVPLHLRVEGEYRKTPLTLQGTLGSLHALLANQPLDVALHSAMAGVELRVNGRMAHPLDGSGIALDIELSAPGMGGLAKLMEMPLALDAPLSFKAMLKDHPDGFELLGMQARLGDNDIAGDVRFGVWLPRPRLDATLQSERISLSNLLPEKKHRKAKPVAATGSKGRGKHRAEKPARLLPQEPIEVQALKKLDAGIAWKVKRFSMPKLQLTNMDAKLGLKGGVLKISPFKARVASGNMRLSLTLRGDQSPARLAVSFTGRHIVAARLLRQSEGKKKQAPFIQGGKLDVDVRMKGRGASLARIMAHSNGRIKLRIGKARVKSDALNLVGGDMLVMLFDKLNPFSDARDYTELQCGVVHFRIRNGIMLSEDGIAFETGRMNILSEGKINLRDESIDLSIGTEPREGIGINLSNMVNVVRLGGTLAEPGIVPDAAKTGMAAARVAGAVVTGGLSLLGESLFNRATADSTPCKTALEMK